MIDSRGWEPEREAEKAIFWLVCPAGAGRDQLGAGQVQTDRRTIDVQVGEIWLESIVPLCCPQYV